MKCSNVLLKTNVSRHTSGVLNQVRGVSLDISKPFDKEWHYGLNFKLTQKRRQRVVLNIQASTWTNITAGVP